MIHRRARLLVLTLFALCWAIPCLGQNLPSAKAPVVINEIMYHPALDLEDLQYVEIINRTNDPADLSGWKFTDGIDFEFPKGTILPAGGLGLIAKNAEALRRRYRLEPELILGEFQGNLSNSGETLTLENASQVTMDAVEYADQSPWPTAPDGYGSSLERIHTDSPGNLPENWEASNLPNDKTPSGTPGSQNDRHGVNLPPKIHRVQFEPKWPKPNEKVTVTAVIEDADGVSSVVLQYAIAGQNPNPESATITMNRLSGDSNQGVYQGQIPGVNTHQIVRFRVEARDSAKMIRRLPSEQEPAPFYSYIVFQDENTAKVPFGFVYHNSPIERGQAFNRYQRGPTVERTPTRGDQSFVYLPPGGRQPQLFDFIRVTLRPSGFKLRFRKEEPLLGMRTVNIVFEQSPRQVLSEHLSYEVYRRARVPAPYSDLIRIAINDRLAGYHLLVEQPNESFLKRHEKDDTGNLYKLIWYENNVVSKHEKKTNLHTGHEDLLETLDQLQRLSGKEEWAYIQSAFDVSEFTRYYAVSMCVSDWDGFFNNYFLYHDLGKNGKWEIFPWDKDKTWGDYDGASSRYDWYTMPLDFGMDNARQPGLGDRIRFGGGPFGGTSWWRPPGYFSGPLLANPFFREQFLRTLHDFCQSEFTPQKFMPVINDLEERLGPEVRLRGQMLRRNSDFEFQQFQTDIESFRKQLIHRREFILKQLPY